MQEPTKPHSRTYGITKPFYMGWKNAIKIGLYRDGKLIPVGTVSSGISDKLKQDMTNDPDKYIGKVVECGIMEKEESAFRHPVFIRFRDDKDPKECIFNEVFQ